VYLRVFVYLCTHPRLHKRICMMCICSPGHVGAESCCLHAGTNASVKNRKHTVLTCQVGGWFIHAQTCLDRAVAQREK